MILDEQSTVDSYRWYFRADVSRIMWRIMGNVRSHLSKFVDIAGPWTDLGAHFVLITYLVMSALLNDIPISNITGYHLLRWIAPHE